MSRCRQTGHLRASLTAVLGPDVAEEFIAIAERQIGKPISQMTASDINTPRLQKELEAIEVRHWLREQRRAKRPNSPGELGTHPRRPENGRDPSVNRGTPYD